MASILQSYRLSVGLSLAVYGVKCNLHFPATGYRVATLLQYDTGYRNVPIAHLKCFGTSSLHIIYVTV